MDIETYVPLEAVTLTNQATEVNFYAIPTSDESGTFRDLVLVINGGSTTNQSFWLQFNGDTATNYFFCYYAGNGSSAFHGQGASQTGVFVGSSLNNNNNSVIVEIMDYSKSDRHKPLLSKDNNTSGQVVRVAGKWQNTAAVNSIRIYGNGNWNFNAGMTVSLYAIHG